MKPKRAYITISDFKRYRNDWCTLRATMNHQPSSIAAGKKDLHVFTSRTSSSLKLELLKL